VLRIVTEGKKTKETNGYIGMGLWEVKKRGEVLRKHNV
jgi:hypothetical protein